VDSHSTGRCDELLFLTTVFSCSFIYLSVNNQSPSVALMVHYSLQSGAGNTPAFIFSRCLSSTFTLRSDTCSFMRVVVVIVVVVVVVVVVVTAVK